MALVYSCIAPHGGEIIPELASRTMLHKFLQTREAMKAIGRKIQNAQPHTIIIASPHNLRVWKRIAVVTSEQSSGILKGAGKSSVSLQAQCDRAFAKRIVQASEKARIPTVGVNYGTAEGPASDMQMDWGTLVPLWFALTPKKKHNPEIVVVAPSREIPLRMNYRFGQLLSRMMKRERRKRFVFIASADQAHAHSRSGPYGFSPAAARYDKTVADYVRANKLGKIMSFDPGFVEQAKPDSLWQMTMLAGVTSVVPSSSRLLSYEVPTYYGMACAEFEPSHKRAG